MIEFVRTIGASEVSSGYLNLTDDDGVSYGSIFPPHRTPLWIITNGQRFKASRGGLNQIWGVLKNWFDEFEIQAGDIISVRYNPEVSPIDARVPVEIEFIRSFSGFDEADFAAFEEYKHSDPKYNDERKHVRDKMVLLKMWLDPRLEHDSILLTGKVSHSYYHSVYRKHVVGIWLAYTDKQSRYFEHPQLNCGIYAQGIFAGLELPRKAQESQIQLLDYAIDNYRDFALITQGLDRKLLETQLQTAAGLISTSIELHDLEKTRERIVQERCWLSLGEWIPHSSELAQTHKLRNHILGVFQTIYPLYLLASGVESFGSLAADSRTHAMDQTTADAFVKSASRYLPRGRDDSDLIVAIANIDAKNVNPPSGTERRSSGVARNPLLSSYIKQLRNDRCQICGANYDLGNKYFCEAHHIIPLSAGGLDQSSNMIVVCPNHHKIMDNVPVEVLEESDDELKIEFEGKEYCIKL